MRSDMPSLTVLMPVYNGARYLDEAIASVVSQDFSDFEFVIVDDGSTDATPQILRRWVDRDSRIVIVRLPDNTGIPTALNHGLAVARGKYVARQDADDLSLPGRLRRQVDVLERRPEAVLVSGSSDIIDARGKRIGRERRNEPPEVTAFLLNFSNAVGGHGQVTFRREAVMEVGGYRHEFALSEDYDLWTRLSRRGHIVMVDMVSNQYRQHPERSSVTGRRRQRGNSLRITRRMLTELLHREITADEELAVASVWRQEGRRDVAARAHRLLREAYGRFTATDRSRHHRRRVRMATARRWLMSAVALARKGEWLEGLAHVLYGFLWHPIGALQGIAHFTGRAGVHLLRAAKRRRAQRYDWPAEPDQYTSAA